MVLLQKLYKAAMSSVFILALACFTPAFAQPSGGSYGPVPQKYELPVVPGTTSLWPTKSLSDPLLMFGNRLNYVTD